jgi:hypothetical protein
MSAGWRITEEQLYEVNVIQQRAMETLLHNLVTRTAQESKLFPLAPYVFLSFHDAYYRYPDLLRESMRAIGPEECAHWAREVSTPFTRMRAYSTLTFYLLGRINLIKLGLLAPQDNLEDLWLVCHWWRRYMNAFNRADGHQYARDAGDMVTYHPERVLQVFEADAFSCDGRPELRRAAARFLATATQYSFLAHCESRLGIQGAGPYSLGDDLVMQTRDFVNLAPGDLSWLDEVAGDVPYPNLTLVMVTRATAIEVTDWGSTYSAPESYGERLVGVGLYTSDLLSNGYQPVGMDSAAELTGTFDELSERLAAATGRLYERFVGMSAHQRIDAGMYTYVQNPPTLLHMAGRYRHADWEFVDHRNERLRGIYNEEYATDAYVENYGALLGTQGAWHEYYLNPVHYGRWRRSGAASGAPLPTNGRMEFPVPAAVLRDHDYSRRVNPGGLAECGGGSSLPAKTGGWLTSRGLLSESDYNAAAAGGRPDLAREPWVHLDDGWVKWHWRSDEARELYERTQARSRLLAGRGAVLRRADLATIRTDAGEPAWTTMSTAGTGPREELT